jgi:anti-sigma regulatory factor (Ser/Thr protein kinase)
VNSFSFESRNPAREKELFFSELRGFAEKNGWSCAIANEVELVLEEWWTNLVNYALADQPSPLVRIAVRSNSRLVTLEIEDNGIPFDPTERPDPDLTLPVEERPIGGLGIYMMKKLSNKMLSERRNGRNFLVIEKDLTRPVLGSANK